MLLNVPHFKLTVLDLTWLAVDFEAEGVIKRRGSCPRGQKHEECVNVLLMKSAKRA